MKFIYSFMAATALCTGAVQAEISSCATIEADLDRLACYDRESGRNPEPVAVEVPGRWIVDVKKSEFEDTTDVFMRVESDEPVACGRFGPPQTAMLYLRCSENTTAIYIATSCHLTSGHGGYGIVDVRLDDDKAFKASMDASTDNEALGHWRGGSAIPFIKRMLGKDRMLVRFTPFSESAVTANFTISGIGDAIKPLRESCKW